MKKIINDVDYENNIFYLTIEDRKIGFYLSKKLSKTFMDYLSPGVLVDFEIQPKRKKVNQRYVHQVAYFTKIVTLKPYRIHYDLEQLRKDMKEVLTHNQYYLFIDFEMTMPGYQQKNFHSEIIQAGYVLSMPQDKVILESSCYIKPILEKELSKRTQKFLKIDQENFDKQAIKYDVFYRKLKKVVQKYNPKFVVWGKNDITSLNDSYYLHKKKVLTQNNDFIDLLKLHKDYYNLKDDLGLFKAYKTYYDVIESQIHDAADDAKVTKYVFDAFLLNI